MTLVDLTAGQLIGSTGMETMQYQPDPQEVLMTGVARIWPFRKCMFGAQGDQSESSLCFCALPSSAVVMGFTKVVSTNSVLGGRWKNVAVTAQRGKQW